MAVASVAAAIACVEAESVGLPASPPRILAIGKVLADVVPEANVGGRCGARCFADRGLVDLQHSGNRLPALNARAATPVNGAGPASLGALQVHHPAEVAANHIAHQARLARARDPGYNCESVQWDSYTHALQVVKPCILHHQPLFWGLTQRLQWVLHGASKVASRHGRSAGLEVGLASLGHHLATSAPSARAHVDEVVGHGERLLVMLDHHHGVALLLELAQQHQKGLIVLRMQSNRGLIEDVADPLQVRTQLRGQSNALGLAAREGGGRTVQRQIPQAHRAEEVHPAANFLHQVLCDGEGSGVKAFGQRLEPVGQFGDGQS